MPFFHFFLFRLLSGLDASVRLIGEPSTQGLWFSYQMDDPHSGEGYVYFSVTYDDVYQDAADIRQGTRAMDHCTGTRHQMDGALHPVFLHCPLEFNELYRLWVSVDTNGRGENEKIVTPGGIQVSLLGSQKAHTEPPTPVLWAEYEPSLSPSPSPHFTRPSHSPSFIPSTNPFTSSPSYPPTSSPSIYVEPNVDVQIISPVTSESLRIRYSIMNPVQGGNLYWTLAEPGVRLTSAQVRDPQNAINPSCCGSEFQVDSRWHMLLLQKCHVEGGKPYLLWVSTDHDGNGKQDKMVFPNGLKLYVAPSKMTPGDMSECECGTDCIHNGRLGICNAKGICQIDEIVQCRDPGSKKEICQEAPLCSAHLCEIRPDAIPFCPCTCNSFSTSTTPIPTQTPTTPCVESMQCSESICRRNPLSASWYCPCSCPKRNLQPEIHEKKQANGGYGDFQDDAKFCYGLPWNQCYGVSYTGMQCMWHVRDGECKEGNPHSLQDVCATYSDPRQCNSAHGYGGCCWDSDGYCDRFDEGDCRVFISSESTSKKRASRFWVLGFGLFLIFSFSCLICCIRDVRPDENQEIEKWGYQYYLNQNIV